ncbi:hypothetical protein MBLNU230_g4799t1 [Neophaeotheca triangularis]
MKLTGIVAFAALLIPILALPGPIAPQVASIEPREPKSILKKPKFPKFSRPKHEPRDCRVVSRDHEEGTAALECRKKTWKHCTKLPQPASGGYQRWLCGKGKKKTAVIENWPHAEGADEEDLPFAKEGHTLMSPETCESTTEGCKGAGDTSGSLDALHLHPWDIPTTRTPSEPGSATTLRVQADQNATQTVGEVTAVTTMTADSTESSLPLLNSRYRHTGGKQTRDNPFQLEKRYFGEDEYGDFPDLHLDAYKKCYVEYTGPEGRSTLFCKKSPGVHVYKDKGERLINCELLRERSKKGLRQWDCQRLGEFGSLAIEHPEAERAKKEADEKEQRRLDWHAARKQKKADKKEEKKRKKEEEKKAKEEKKKAELEEKALEEAAGLGKRGQQVTSNPSSVDPRLLNSRACSTIYSMQTYTTVDSKSDMTQTKTTSMPMVTCPDSLRTVSQDCRPSYVSTIYYSNVPCSSCSHGYSTETHTATMGVVSPGCTNAVAGTSVAPTPAPQSSMASSSMASNQTSQPPNTSSEGSTAQSSKHSEESLQPSSSKVPSDTGANSQAPSMYLQTSTKAFSMPSSLVGVNPTVSSPPDPSSLGTNSIAPSMLSQTSTNIASLKSSFVANTPSSARSSTSARSANPLWTDGIPGWPKTESTQPTSVTSSSVCHSATDPANVDVNSMIANMMGCGKSDSSAEASSTGASLVSASSTSVGSTSMSSAESPSPKSSSVAISSSEASLPVSSMASPTSTQGASSLVANSPGSSMKEPTQASISWPAPSSSIATSSAPTQQPPPSPPRPSQMSPAGSSTNTAAPPNVQQESRPVYQNSSPANPSQAQPTPTGLSTLPSPYPYFPSAAQPATQEGATFSSSYISFVASTAPNAVNTPPPTVLDAFNRPPNSPNNPWYHARPGYNEADNYHAVPVENAQNVAPAPQTVYYTVTKAQSPNSVVYNEAPRVLQAPTMMANNPASGSPNVAYYEPKPAAVAPGQVVDQNQPQSIEVITPLVTVPASNVLTVYAPPVTATMRPVTNGGRYGYMDPQKRSLDSSGAPHESDPDGKLQKRNGDKKERHRCSIINRNFDTGLAMFQCGKKGKHFYHDCSQVMTNHKDGYPRWVCGNTKRRIREDQPSQENFTFRKGDPSANSMLRVVNPNIPNAVPVGAVPGNGGSGVVLPPAVVNPLVTTHLTQVLPVTDKLGNLISEVTQVIATPILPGPTPDIATALMGPVIMTKRNAAEEDQEQQATLAVRHNAPRAPYQVNDVWPLTTWTETVLLPEPSGVEYHVIQDSLANAPRPAFVKVEKRELGVPPPPPSTMTTTTTSVARLETGFATVVAGEEGGEVVSCETAAAAVAECARCGGCGGCEECSGCSQCEEMSEQQGPATLASRQGGGGLGEVGKAMGRGLGKLWEKITRREG